MVTGVAWYTSSEWARVRATAVDQERFEASFDEWLAMAEKALADLQRAGVRAQKYPINAEQFLQWCAAQRLNNDAAARSRFVAEKLRSDSDAGGA